MAPEAFLLSFSLFRFLIRGHWLSKRASRTWFACGVWRSLNSASAAKEFPSWCCAPRCWLRWRRACSVGAAASDSRRVHLVVAMHPPHHSHSSHWRHQVSHPSSSGHVPPPPGGDEDYGPSGRASSSSFAWEGRPRREDASDFAASSAASSVPLKNLGGHAHPPRAGFGYGESFHGGGEASAAAFEAFVEGEASRGSWSEEPLTAEKQRSLQGFSAANAGLRGAGPSSSFSGGPRQGSSAYPHSHPHSHSHLHSQSSSSACCYKLAASSLSAAPPAFPLGQGGSFPEGGAGAFSNWISTTPSTAPGGLPPPSGLSRRSRRSSAEQPLPAGSAHSAVAAACVARPEAILWVHQPCAARPSSLAPSFVSTGPRAELAVEGAGAGAVDADGFFPSLGVSDELAGMAGLGGVGSSEGAGAGPPWISAGRRRLAPSSSGTSFSYIPSRDPRLPPAEKERIARQWLSAPRRSLSEESGGGSFCGSRPEVVASVEASRAWVRMKASKRAAQKPGKSLPAFHLDPAASSSWLTRESGLFSPVVEREVGGNRWGFDRRCGRHSLSVCLSCTSQKPVSAAPFLFRIFFCRPLWKRFWLKTRRACCEAAL